MILDCIIKFNNNLYNARFVIFYLPDSVAVILDLYASLPAQLEGYIDMNDSVHQDNATSALEAYNYILQNKDIFIPKRTEQEYEIGLMAAHVIKEREIIYRSVDYGAHRDRLMAFYTEWWQRI